MKFHTLPERADWREQAEKAGFHFHTLAGKPYWSEGGVYAFTEEEIDRDLDSVATDLHGMCRAAVAEIVGSEELMERFAIPPSRRDFVAQSWKSQEPELYGRFDFIYDGTGPARMIEYNADTPTTLFEAAVFQWDWFEQQKAAGVLPVDADQYNAIYEAIRDRFAAIFPQGTDIHFATLGEASGANEDYGTVETLAYMARDAGMGAHYTDLAGIGLTDAGQFADAEERLIGTLFALYPWEDMLRDEFSAHLATSGCRFIEPAWKALVSNKAILPVLWRMFEGHPNLLPAFFPEEIEAGGDPVVARSLARIEAGHVSKPIFSREGASITIREGGQILEASANRAYDKHPTIVQEYCPMPEFEGGRPVLGIWMAGTEACGMSIREDASRITQDLSLFRPHVILP